MITIRRHDERGHGNHGWLDAHHTFSFGNYLDRNHMGFRSLRVMNEDRIAPGKGFGTHGHDNMEIITYVIDGAIQHRDSMGNGSVIPAGSFQRITAGTGITHSEFNPSDTNELHLYQIWIEPAERGLTPSYQEWYTPKELARNIFHPVARQRGEGDVITVHQDATLLLATLDKGVAVTQEIDSARHGWAQVISGRVTLNGHTLTEGDGAAISDESLLTFVADEASQIFLFDLA